MGNAHLRQLLSNLQQRAQLRRLVGETGQNIRQRLPLFQGIQALNERSFQSTIHAGLLQ